MRSNLLKLNGDKSEYLIFGSTQNLGKLNVRSVHINQAAINCNFTPRYREHLALQPATEASQ